MNLTRLKLLTIVLPVLFLVAADLLRNAVFRDALYTPPGFFGTYFITVAAVTAFSFWVFGLIGRLQEQLQRTNWDLAALLAVGTAATSSLDLDELLGRSTETLLQVTGVEEAEVWVVEGPEAVLRVHRGPAAPAFLTRTVFPLGEGFPGIIAETRGPLMTHQLSEEPRFLREEVTAAGFNTLGGWPLLRGGRVLGVLLVAARSPDALTAPGEIRLLEGIAEHLAVALENSLLHRQVQDAAVLEERERIAREMHDGLAQVLGYLNTQVLALRKLLASGATQAALEQLAAMQESVRALYADVREAILGLRSSPGERRGIESILREYLERYRSIAGFEIALEIAPEVETVHLARARQIQLLRIVQEALSNVRKHAGARRAMVALQRVGDALELRVSDDGIGFNLADRVATGWPRFGLQTMRERAEAIGGEFTLESTPGAGSTVLVRVPAVHEATYARVAG